MTQRAPASHGAMKSLSDAHEAVSGLYLRPNTSSFLQSLTMVCSHSRLWTGLQQRSTEVTSIDRYLCTVVKIVDWSWMGDVLYCMNVSLQTQESVSTEFTKRLTWSQTYDRTTTQLLLTAATNVNELNPTIKVTAGGEHTTKPPLLMKVYLCDSGADVWRDNVLKIYWRYV